MNQPSSQPIHIDDMPSPMALLVIILLVALIHIFAIIIALSVSPQPKPAVNVLQAQILSAADAKRMVQGTAAKNQQTKAHNKATTKQFQPIKPKYQAPIATEMNDFGQMPTYDEPIATPTQTPDEMTDTAAASTDKSLDAPPNIKPKTAPSANLKKAAQSATTRIISAWQNYENIGGKKLTITIWLDDTGNVIDIKVGKGDQELAQTAIAAIHDSAPFSEVAGLSDKLTIQFNSIER